LYFGDLADLVHEVVGTLGVESPVEIGVDLHDREVPGVVESLVVVGNFANQGEDVLVDPGEEVAFLVDQLLGLEGRLAVSLRLHEDHRVLVAEMVEDLLGIGLSEAEGFALLLSELLEGLVGLASGLAKVDDGGVVLHELLQILDGLEDADGGGGLLLHEGSDAGGVARALVLRCGALSEDLHGGIPRHAEAGAEVALHGRVDLCQLHVGVFQGCGCLGVLWS